MRNLSYENEFCMQFHFHANQSHFHKNDFAPRLALKQRHKGTLGNGLLSVQYQNLVVLVFRLLNKVVIELRVVQFWSEIILVISNRTRAARSFDFEITRMISDQIAHNYHKSNSIIFPTRSVEQKLCSVATISKTQ